jgi:hypothetical protein
VILGTWIDEPPAAIARSRGSIAEYVRALHAGGVRAFAVMAEGSDDGHGPRWSYGELAELASVLDELKVPSSRRVLTSWWEPERAWVNAYLRWLPSAIDALGAGVLEGDLEHQWKRRFARRDFGSRPDGRGNLEAAGDYVVAALREAHPDLELRTTTFPEHLEADAAATVTDQVEALTLQVYTLASRGGVPRDRAGRFGPSSYPHDELLESIGEFGGAVKVHAALAVFGQSAWGDPVGTILEAADAVERVGGVEELWLWSGKFMAGGQRHVTPYALEALEALFRRYGEPGGTIVPPPPQLPSEGVVVALRPLDDALERIERARELHVRSASLLDEAGATLRDLRGAVERTRDNRTGDG